MCLIEGGGVLSVEKMHRNLTTTFTPYKLNDQYGRTSVGLLTTFVC